MKNATLFFHYFLGRILAVAMMSNPQSNLTPDEAAICWRLREVRLSLKLGQPDFAKELDIPTSRLASYEYARAPVRFSFGFSLCERFNLSLQWLATGKLPSHPFTPIAPILVSKIRQRDLFSVVYKNHLSLLVESRLKELKTERLGKGELIWDFRRLGVSRAESHLQNVIELIRSVASELDDETKLQFAFALERLAFSNSPLTNEAARKLGLTKTATYGKDEGVKEQWPMLKRKIQKAVSDPGAKTTLAKFLGVELAQLSKWLTGSKKSAREPGAEYALRMQFWVEHPGVPKIKNCADA